MGAAMALKCPITGDNTEKKCHRRCEGPGCKGVDCYDCCEACWIDCKEPPKTAETVQLADGLDIDEEYWKP